MRKFSNTQVKNAGKVLCNSSKYKKSEVEEAFGNYKTALFYNQKYSSTIRENNDKINKNKIEQLQVDFKVTEKENEIKQLEITSLQKTLNIEKQRKYLIISSFFILLK